MKNRLKEIITYSGVKLPKIAKESGLSLEKWKGVLYGPTRVNEDHINFVAKKWPQFVHWLVTGETQEKCGNINPDIEEFERIKNRIDNEP